MKEIFVTGDNIITSLGFTSEENFTALKKGTIGIRQPADTSLSTFKGPLSLVDTIKLDEAFAGMVCELGKDVSGGFYTRLEKMMILSVYRATLEQKISMNSSRLVFIISTTKGNIHLLEEKYRLIHDHKRLYLWELARVVASFFGLVNTPVIVSNACISGVVGIMLGARYIRSGQFSHAIVTGGDILSEFVISGFQSFQSLSLAPCRPYDISRDGLSLGEGCGTVVLTDLMPEHGPAIRVLEGSVTNDANHISGPSRTGEELGLAMQTAMQRSGLQPEDISLVSAHGTATSFNDEMESKAITNAGLNHVPVNSLKGYWGHTLGAAGVIESIASIKSLMADTLIGSAGFSTSGVPDPMNVVRETVQTPLITCLKTASGFGGCNAALILQKQPA
jgi:3-oxoacyl-[acyl-carrier-protein] synthase I